MNYPEGQIVNDNVSSLSIQRQLVSPNLKNNIENHLINFMACVFTMIFLSIALANGFSAKSFLGNSSMQIAINPAQNIFDFAYLITAAGIVIITLLGEKASVNFMQTIGKIYIFAALIGFMKFGSQNSNEWVSFINLGLGISLTSAGSILKDYRHDLLVARLISKQRELNNPTIVEEISETILGTILLKHSSISSDKELDFEDFSETNYKKGEFI